MRFCGRCGFDYGDGPSEQPARERPSEHPARNEPTRPRALVSTPAVALAAVVVVGLLLYLGFFAGRGPGGPGPAGTSPPSGAPGTAATVGSPAATPLLIGLTIVSPADGAVVATNKVVVIGTAPPGLTITQDISLGLDRHTQVDGTGHWAMEMELSEGVNQMTFRIGDDKSTARTISVVYQPPPAPS
jgi:hypothetical protein